VPVGWAVPTSQASYVVGTAHPTVWLVFRQPLSLPCFVIPGHPQYVIQCKSIESDPIDYGFRHCTVSIDIVVPFRNMSPIRPLAAGTTPSPRLRFLPFSQIIQLLRQLRCLVLQLTCQLGRFPCHPAGLDRFANRVSKVGYGGDDTQSGTHKVTFPNRQTRRNQVVGRRRINEIMATSWAGMRNKPQQSGATGKRRDGRWVSFLNPVY